MRNMLCVPFLAFVGLHAQTLEVSPSQAMVDQPVSIRVTQCQPNERVSIRAELVDGADERWSSQADFVTDAKGAIDTSKQPALQGSYKGQSSMGLVWSMMPSLRESSRYTPPKDLGAQIIDFQLIRGGVQLAATRLLQVAMTEGIERISLRDASLRGVLFLPPGANQHPAVLVLGGSEGGLLSRRAAWLASHGFAALALAYFRYDDLPRELAGIPLEYFGHALNWLAHRPDIAADHVAIMGTSRGAELSLQLGSMFSGIKAVVAYSPADVRYPACCGFTSVPYPWTWNGMPLAFRSIHRKAIEPDITGRATIEVERTQGPILLISGKDDHVWDSSEMADSIVARLRRFHFQHNVVELKYSHAGHAAGRPEIVPAWQGRTINPTSGREVEMGGTPSGNAESSLDAIPKVIEFLHQRLSEP